MEDQAHSPQNRSTRSARLMNLIHRYRNVARKYWWILPVTLASALAVQGVLIFRAPPVFASASKMTVAPQNTLIKTMVEEMANFLGTQAEYMKSEVVISKAHERVHRENPKLQPVPVNLNIAIAQRTSVFNLGASGSEPLYVRAFLDALMLDFIEFKRDLIKSSANKTLTEIADRISTLSRDLNRYDDALQNFKASNSVIILETTGNVLANSLGELSRQQEALQREFQLLNLLDDDANMERQRKTEVGADGQPTAVNYLDTEYFRTKQNLHLFKADLEDRSLYLKPKHPRIVDLKERIASLERLIGIYKVQNKEQIESRRKNVALQIQTNEKDIERKKSDAVDVSRKMAEYDRIKSSKERTQKEYDKLNDVVTTLGQGYQADIVSVLEKASQAFPSRGSAVRALIVAGIMGLILGAAALLVIDRFDDKPASFTDLQDMFDEPVLGQIPLEHSSNPDEEVGLIRSEDSRHAFLEAYRNIRSSLLYMATEGKRPKTLLVTSAIPGDGKSMTTANLAITMALAGSKVLLIDADMRRGRLHDEFAIKAAPGLGEVLCGETLWEQAVQQTPTANLHLLPRGDFARNPGEMFLGKAMQTLLKEAPQKFDYVIFDTAPVMAADDVTTLAPHVEGVIFVIRANTTSARVARAALDLLYQRDVDVLGIAFNGVQTNTSEYYYYKYKSYYAGKHKA